jgi:spermidine synthase
VRPWAPPRARRAQLILAVAGATVILAAVAPDRVFRLRYARDSFLGRTQSGDARYVLEHVAWDPIARIELSRVPPPQAEGSPWPSLFGPDRGLLERFRLVITQNNNAFTYAPAWDGNPQSIRGLGETVYAAAYRASLTPRPRVLVIGVGGGMDVLTALAFDASSVVGVEVNRATLDLVQYVYADYFRTWAAHPRVRLVHDEGRHYLASRPDRFDVLQLSGVDSVSGTPGAAHVFSESYLYTAEAFDLYLSRLSPAGILNVMRPDSLPSRDGLRLVATVFEALRRRGVARPAEQVMVVADRTGQFVAVLATAQPYTAEQVRQVAAWTSRNPYLTLAAAPGREPEAPAVFAAALSASSVPALRAALAGWPWDVLPVDDDRPFFFRTSRWIHLWPPARGDDPGTPVMELGLLTLLAVCLVAAVVLVYAPLRRLPRLQGAGAPRTAAFFGLLGLGYMAVEMALIQKFGMFLGHPNHALTVVLASLLLATGVGSLLSAPIVRAAGGRLRFVSYALSLVLLAELLLAFPRLRAWVGLSLGLRVAVVFGLVLPAGVLLGTFFPTGLERLKSGAPAWVPWAWGLNGMASVIAPVLSIAVSMTTGISTLLLAAVPLYLLAGFVEPAAPASPPAARDAELSSARRA